MSEASRQKDRGPTAKAGSDLDPGAPVRLAIVGTGYMGTSIGLALGERTDIYRIVGWDPDTASLAAAHERRAIHRKAFGLADAVADADLVLIAAPVDRVAAIAVDVALKAPPGATVTDIAGTKQRIVRVCEDLLGSRFVGGHPMAGSENSGPGRARADVLADAPWILTPTDHTDPRAVATAEALIRNTGARPVPMTPPDHDRLAAWLSHLPHVVAYALAGTIAGAFDRETQDLAGGSFRSATRVAASDPLHWSAILLDNRRAILEALDQLQDRVGMIRSALADSDALRLRSLLTEGHRQ